jgi:hypothetical protein
MAVPTSLRGPYRQLTRTLKIYTDGQPGKRRVSERPYAVGEYTDSEEEPTLVEVHASDAVDVEALLATGAIVPYDPPKTIDARRETASRPSEASRPEPSKEGG